MRRNRGGFLMDLWDEAHLNVLRLCVATRCYEFSIATSSVFRSPVTWGIISSYLGALTMDLAFFQAAYPVCSQSPACAWISNRLDIRRRSFNPSIYVVTLFASSFVEDFYKVGSQIEFLAQHVGEGLELISFSCPELRLKCSDSIARLPFIIGPSGGVVLPPKRTTAKSRQPTRII
ncbi:hypothetical protein BJY01DRAFT_210721 [Aspergillus pseudoustus]|uniref:Uncharacterized protein n=1 Tax=Aspergillus pseudoustus TaxID=1810923 RepID=A0ABR4KB66_9EURO